MIKLALAILPLAACKHSAWNGSKVATELHIANTTIPIPDGWRSLAEAADPKLRPSPTSVGMMPEAHVDGVLTATIIMTEKPTSEWATCTQAVANAKAGLPAPIDDVHDGGTACRWHTMIGRLDAIVGMRRIGDGELDFQCLIDHGKDPEAERVCATVRAQLQLP